MNDSLRIIFSIFLGIIIIQFAFSFCDDFKIINIEEIRLN